MFATRIICSDHAANDARGNSRILFVPPNAPISNLDGVKNGCSKCLVAILLQIALCSLSLHAQSPQPGTERITLPDSIRESPAGAQGAATLVRSELSQAESETTMEFSVALKMRDFAALKERIARNEVISADEMAAKYLPTAADYANVAKWLTSPGLFRKAGNPGSNQHFRYRHGCANRANSRDEIRPS